MPTLTVRVKIITGSLVILENIFPPKLPLPLLWRVGTTPILEKTLRECWGKWKSFTWVPINSGNRSGSCSENCGFRIAQVVGCHSENGISYSENGISNSESCSENTPELSESSENGLFTPRAFFLKLGWSPGFWITVLKFGRTNLITITVTVLASIVNPSISIGSQLPSWKSFELTFSKLPLPLPSWNVFELER